MIEVLNDRDIKKTRKPHRCFGCCEMIPAGSPAHAQSNTYDGEAYTVYTHMACEEIMMKPGFFDDFREDEGFAEGCVRDYLREIGFEGGPEEYVEKERR